MRRKITTSFLILVVCTLLSKYAYAQSSHHPLSESDLLALVAGQTLPENVVSEINRCGINFKPDLAYASLLKAAGANSQIFNALDSARQFLYENTPASDGQSLRHLSSAGKLIRLRQFDGATAELTAVLSNNSTKAAAGYVMGKVLIDQNRSDEAFRVYSEVLSLDQDFPEVHTRLSFLDLSGGDPEEALRQTKAALERNPDNPVAHLNAGLAYQQLNKSDAAKSEFQQAVRCKPDYALAYSAFGYLFLSENDFDGAIAQYKRALVLTPEDIGSRFNLAFAYQKKGDRESEIREYREILRRDPKQLDALQNLGAALVQVDPPAAIVVFRKLASLAPDRPLCHQCLASALRAAGNMQEADKENRIAAKMDPANPMPRLGLAASLESAKKYDAALAEYREIEKLDDTFSPAYNGAGRVLLYKKDYAGAAAELKRATELAPTEWADHDLLGQALEGTGDRAAAIAEYKQAIMLAPKEVQARLDLAQAQEKSGDWVAALQNYHQAAIDKPAIKLGVPQWEYRVEEKYAAAKERFEKYVAVLRSEGKSEEASKLEASLNEREAAPNVDAKFHDIMQAGLKAIQERRFEEAETSAKEAIATAEKIHPLDGRLPEAVGLLGNVYLWRLENKKAEEAFQRQLQLTEQLYGGQSPLISAALQNLAMTAYGQKDFTTAETIFNRMVELNVKGYGENSVGTANALRGLAHVYLMRHDYEKSETVMLRVLKIFEATYGANDPQIAVPMTGLCQIYDQWGKTDKAATCHSRLSALAQNN